ncbi:MAG TPA: histidine kinase dimerization/phosphoacceptor domain-containing protein [Candidatus Dormibacteraeota bacterium]|nr:histidine kinase dimerization/phosphoacceptor domain-containing protein [Candidatus Dormibacteraeota bacterium]
MVQPFATLLSAIRDQQGDLVAWSFPSGNEVRFPRRFVIPFAVVLVVGISIWSYEVANAPWTPGRIVAVGLADLAIVAVQIAACLRQGRNRPRERTTLVLALILATLASVAVQGWYGPSLYALGVSILWLGRIGVPGLVMLGPTVLAYLGILVVAAHGHVSPGWTAYGGFVILLMYVGPMFGRRQRRLQHERIAEQERARLAREVHDVLAHTLTASPSSSRAPAC